MIRIAMAAALMCLTSGTAWAHEGRPQGDGHNHRLDIVAQTTILNPGARRVQVAVTPNRLIYEEALQVASKRAARYCQEQFQSSRVSIALTARYAEFDPESWAFRARCR